MADITKCSGEGCPLKSQCYRHTAPSNDYWQSYFQTPPFTLDDKVFGCDHFYNMNAEEIIKELNNER